MSDILYKNLNVHYTDVGDGRTLVFLHGFLENKGMWKDIEPVFKKNYRVVSLDLLGHGKTGNLGYIHTMEDQAKMVKYLIDKLKIGQFTVIGHSMGGYVALAFTELFPEYIKGLCLMNSTAMADSKEKKRNRDRGIAAVKQNHKTFIRLAIPNLFSEENRLVFSDKIKKIIEESLHMSQQGIIACLEGMKVRDDRTQILHFNELPILMVIGKKDPALDYQSLIEQTKNTKVEKVVFEDGHMSHIENQQELIEVFTKWFSTC